jgi:hypothetical protein
MIERKMEVASLGSLVGTANVTRRPTEQCWQTRLPGNRHCKLFYNTIWRLRYTAYICNLLSTYYIIFIDVNNWIPDDSLFDDPLHPSDEPRVQFSQRLGRVLGSDLAILSGHSAAAPPQGSSRH